MEDKLKGMRDACSFLVTVCDEDVMAMMTRQVDETDERWQAVRRAAADQSMDQYSAGVQYVSQWCDSLETELSRHVRVDCDEMIARNNSLEVSLVCSLLCICMMK